MQPRARTRIAILGAWIRLLVWLAIGLAIYFGYGRRHSHLTERSATTSALDAEALQG